MIQPAASRPIAPIFHRLNEREPVALRPETQAAAVAYFKANPDEKLVYVRWDGQCISEADMLGKTAVRYVGEGENMKAYGGGYVNSLVSIATDGIPMPVGRRSKVIAAALGEPNWFEVMQAEHAKAA